MAIACFITLPLRGDPTSASNIVHLPFVGQAVRRISREDVMTRLKLIVQARN